MSIESRVKEIIIDQLGCQPSEVVPEADITNDLQADSLDRYELIMGFEDHFDLKIDDDEASKLTTVGKIIDYLRSLNIED
ncbi:MAG: acyl carrier protein [FCB group bacterium]|nr:acyl carrier protein [FCB group bacterium]